MGLKLLPVLVGVMTLFGTANAVTFPPHIYSMPDKNVVYVVNESVALPCFANGIPTPEYKWKMNDEDFDVAGNDRRVTIQPGSGTLVFNQPFPRDEAIYQCLAKNQFGTSVSHKVNLRRAVLEKITNQNLNTHTPQLGNSLSLRCIPPTSYPKGSITWMTMGTNNNQNMQVVSLSNRIAVDHDGNMHITNVQREDYMDGKNYLCSLYNKALRKIEKGFFHKIIPQGDSPTTAPISLMFKSPRTNSVLSGSQLRIMCIFGGNPTPKVSWSRKGKLMSPRAHEESFGMELIFDNIEPEDAGEYGCSGINEGTPQPTEYSFQVIVKVPPKWVEKPESVNVEEGASHSFSCVADGNPSPTYTWFINGTELSKLPHDPRVIANGNEISFINLTKSDAKCVQCNATNQHGYLWSDVFLNVLSEKPTIQDPPLQDQKAAEGQRTVLKCSTIGSPTPLVVWRKGTEQITGGRYKVLDNGDLEIQDVALVDAGTYECNATNKFGTEKASGNLVVRQRTRIITKPLDIMVFKGVEAKFICTAATDPMEAKNLKITWKKDNQDIDFGEAKRMFRNVMDNSLSITGTIYLDTGKYTCLASNGLDEDSASAELIVADVPSPPNQVRVDCTKEGFDVAKITWKPARENYAPILNFIVEYNTTFNPDTWVEAESNLSSVTTEYKFQMSPWANYTFRLRARNKVGISEASDHTGLQEGGQGMCTTTHARPNKNPDDIFAEGDEESMLIIYWTPMPKIDHNGPSFKYKLRYKRVVDTEWQIEDISDPRQYRFVETRPVGVYEPYNITITAMNNDGESTTEPPMIIGYSGEATPEVTVGEVTVNFTNMLPDEVMFEWDQVDTSPNAVKGYFVGYKIKVWLTSKPDEIREYDHILCNRMKFYMQRQDQQDLRNCRLNSRVKVHLTHLPPYSQLSAHILVVNKGFAGPPSSEISFNTPEGEPGPPANFRVTGVGSNHFDLQWEKPIDENGVLIGYNISYRLIIGKALDRLEDFTPVTDPEQLSVRLTGLQPDQLYRIYLHASTRFGKGPPIFLDDRTSPPIPPNPPTFTVVSVADTSANISWVPSRIGNPGSVFYVQYREKGYFEWEYSPDVSRQYWTNLTNLSPGWTYEVRVVAKNGAGQESPARSQYFVTYGSSPTYGHMAESPWFIGLVVILVILALSVFLFGGTKKVRDKKYEEKQSLLRAEAMNKAEMLANQPPPDDDDGEDQYDYDTKESIAASKSAYSSAEGDYKRPPSEYSDEYYDDEDSYYGDQYDSHPYESRQGYYPDESYGPRPMHVRDPKTGKVYSAHEYPQGEYQGHDPNQGPARPLAPGVNLNQPAPGNSNSHSFV